MNNQLQKIAEQVLDVEMRIINWEGSVTEWARDLIRLRVTLEQLLETASTQRDKAREDFIKSLLHKTTVCRDNVLSRARWMTTRNIPGNFRDSNPAKPGDVAGITEKLCNR